MYFPQRIEDNNYFLYLSLGAFTLAQQRKLFLFIDLGNINSSVLIESGFYSAPARSEIIGYRNIIKLRWEKHELPVASMWLAGYEPRECCRFNKTRTNLVASTFPFCAWQRVMLVRLWVHAHVMQMPSKMHFITGEASQLPVLTCPA